MSMHTSHVCVDAAMLSTGNQALYVGHTTAISWLHKVIHGYSWPYFVGHILLAIDVNNKTMYMPLVHQAIYTYSVSVQE